MPTENDCLSCVKLRERITVLELRLHATQQRANGYRKMVEDFDHRRISREIKRSNPDRVHQCCLNLPGEIRRALRNEGCRLMPEVGAGAIVLHRCEHLRLMNLIEVTDTCWTWKGGKNKAGYGTFGWDDTKWIAHRFVYTLFVKSVDPGLVLDHTCRARICVNPSHLEEVTQAVNQLRMAVANDARAAVS